MNDVIETFVIDDLLSSEELFLINKLFVKNKMSYGWKANGGKAYDFGHWNNKIINELIPFKYDVTDLPQWKDVPVYPELWKRINQLYPDTPQTLYRVYINGYTFGTDGYAHVDASWGEGKCTTMVAYLNDKWHHDWAGETVIYDEDNNIETCVTPKPGAAIVFDGRRLHAARPVSRACPSLRLITTFQFTSKESRPNDPLVEKLIEVSTKENHSGSTFWNHLYDTFCAAKELAKDSNKYKDRTDSEDMIKASLFHSAYGTQYYKYDSPFTRDELVQGLGEYAEELVYIFCTLEDRDETIYSNKKGWNTTMHRDLLLMSSANLWSMIPSRPMNQQNALYKKVYRFLTKV